MFKYCITPDTCPPYVDSYPAAYICNREKSSSDGKVNGHWLAILFPHPDKPSEFFDPRGHPLSDYAHEITTFLIRNGNGKYKVNTASYQLPGTKTCAQYCLWFLDQRGMKRSYENTLKTLSTDNLARNEEYVTAYIMKHMRPSVT